MDTVGREDAPEVNVQSTSLGRRALLRAGWAIPVIAATPLMNTASAMSAVNCANLQTKLYKHINSGDYDAASDIVAKMIEGGCRF
jgi:hypothetical protein